MKQTIADIMHIEDCTGCGSCKNICPKDAIDLLNDKEGFLKYNVNLERCIRCGKCVNACPVLNPEYRNSQNPECYAIWAQDDIRLKSSSGGMFSLLANYILKQNGYVAGVVFDRNFEVKHILSSEINEIEQMRKSKYYQSNTGFIFRDIKKILLNEEKKKVLFTGTPCQVAGLYKFLGKNYKNLYTAEIICHGITSKKVFDKYCSDMFQDKVIKSIAFREKQSLGWKSGISIKFDDDTEYTQTASDNVYWEAFGKNISKSKACGNCKFNRLPRQGDLTIGDFWGISRYNNALNDGKGTSVVLINNSKGLELMNSINGDFKMTKEVPIKYAISGNPPLVAPYKNSNQRQRFFEQLDNVNFEKLVEHCNKNYFDVGIVGLWYGLNYGSILTYYALYCVVNKLGYDAIMVNKPNFIWRPLYENPETIANRFISKYCQVSNIHERDKFQLLNTQCDTFLVGSDVVWNYEICGREGGSFFFLDFVDDNKKKIAYAASFGGGYHAPKEEEEKNRYFAKRFDAISVREDRALNICKEHLGVQATKVLDPVFLCEQSNYDKAIEDSKIKVDYKYIMTYILGGNDLQKNIILEISKRLGIEKLINVVNPNNPKRVIEALKLEPVPEPSVEDWLNYIKNCQFFIGDSFHGLCFSIIFRRPFIIAISKSMPSKDRFLTLLSLCGLEDRLWYIEDDNTDKYDVIYRDIDYNEVYDRLKDYKDASLNWLKNALHSKKKVENKYLYETPENCNLGLFYLARSVYKNYAGRTVVTWGENKEFNSILKKYFNIGISYWVAKNQKIVNNKEIRNFSELSGKNKDIFVVIPDIVCTDKDIEIFHQYGYYENVDFIYYHHKPIIITEGDYRKNEYSDVYGNYIKGKVTGNFKIEFKGFNNKVYISDDIKVNQPINLEMNGCSLLKISDKCVFSGENKIVFLGKKCNSETRLEINSNCRFNKNTFVLWSNPIGFEASEIIINKNTTLGAECHLSVNTGNKIIIGADCMFDSEVLLQSGSGHAIFDVTSLKNYRINGEGSALILGDHVWVGKRSTILADTNINSGSIVEYGSVVKGIYPNNCIIGGNPSYIVQKNIAWSRNNGANKLEECGEYISITGMK